MYEKKAQKKSISFRRPRNIKMQAQNKGEKKASGGGKGEKENVIK